MKKLIIFYFFIIIIIINCSASQSGIYFPTEDNKKAQESFIEKIEYSAPTKMIVSYKENTTELNKAKLKYEKALKDQQNSKGNTEMEDNAKKMVELTKELMEYYKVHETVYDCRKDGDVINIIGRNQLGMEGLLGVFDIKDKMLIGRKGYEIEGSFKKKK